MILLHALPLLAVGAAIVALRTDSANAQHYEVPAAFFEKALGPRLKYSCAFYAENCRSLAEAEEAMLQSPDRLPHLRKPAE